jgi:hypothetical protein
MNLSFDSSFMEASTKRVVAIVLLTLIHLVVIAYFLNYRVTVPSAPRVREMFLSLTMPRPQPKIHSLPRTTSNKEKPKKRSLGSPHAFSLTFEPPAERQPDVSVLGRTLFNCGIGTRGDLAEDHRADCSHLAIQPPVADSELGMPKSTMAKQGVRWAAAIVKRNTPLRLQCTYMGDTPAAMTGGQSAKPILMVDVLCVAKGLINGFGPPGPPGTPK